LGGRRCASVRPALVLTVRARCPPPAEPVAKGSRGKEGNGMGDGDGDSGGCLAAGDYRLVGASSRHRARPVEG